jgi:hypothetical protein
MDEKIKNVFEILALVLGGVFVFFTWGLDQINDREPSWKIYIDAVGGDRVQLNKINNYEICADVTACKTVACKYSGVVKFENQSKRSVGITTTIVEIYPIGKLTSDGEDLSPFYMYKKACLPSNDTGKCQNKALYKTNIGPLDDSPLYSGVEAWRPFSFFINKNDKTEKYLTETSFIIKATQVVESQDTLKWWVTNTHESIAVYYDDLVCGFGKQFLPL